MVCGFLIFSISKCLYRFTICFLAGPNHCIKASWDSPVKLFVEREFCSGALGNIFFPTEESSYVFQAPHFTTP